MFEQFSDGYCPECMLNDKKVPMMLNTGDLWECPECRLQATSGSVGTFVLLRKRGTGQLSTSMTKATDNVIGWLLDKAQKGSSLRKCFSPEGSGFDSEEELRQFLKNEVK